ncbi:MAG: hypothetical protein KJ922_05440 [Nanoarchaeota archaeon]|nr:hypothetical protein [Nanoarchaeota archaeon]
MKRLENILRLAFFTSLALSIVNVSEYAVYRYAVMPYIQNEIGASRTYSLADKMLAAWQEFPMPAKLVSYGSKVALNNLVEPLN